MELIYKGIKVNETKIAIITLVVSNLTAIAIAIFTFVVNNMYTRKIRDIQEQNNVLKTLLNPLCSLIKENNEIYFEFGPKTFSKYDHHKRIESAEIWESIKKEIILRNLDQIRNIILSNTHLVQELGLEVTCNELKIHCISFIEYNNNPSELYKKHKYKSEWLNVLDGKRTEIIKELNQ